MSFIIYAIINIVAINVIIKDKSNNPIATNIVSVGIVPNALYIATTPPPVVMAVIIADGGYYSR